MSAGDPPSCGQCPYRNGGFGYNPYISLSPPVKLLKVVCPICGGSGCWKKPLTSITSVTSGQCPGCFGTGIQEVSYNG